VYGGEGLARHEGQVVFLPYVLPGERVQVRAERAAQPGYLRPHSMDLLEASPARVDALCPYYGRCGGCHYQHAPYELQLSAKRAILAEELRRLGKIEPPEEIAVLAGEPFGYRNRVQLRVAHGHLGYREARSPKLCGILHCPIASPALNAAIGTLVEMLRDLRWPRFLRGLELFSDGQKLQVNVIETEAPVARRFFDWCAETLPGLVEGALDYEGRFRVSPHSFFQVNRFLVDQLVEAAVEGAGGETAADVYAGVGLFSLALARRFGQVQAVESGAGAVRDLQFNAERAGAANLQGQQATAEDYLTKLERPPEFVLLDPPRAGLGKVVVRRLAELKPPRLALVSCDPATLARDLAGLLLAGYRIEKLTLVDLFPQTFHLETVARLALSGAG